MRTRSMGEHVTSGAGEDAHAWWHVMLHGPNNPTRLGIAGLVRWRLIGCPHGGCCMEWTPLGTRSHVTGWASTVKDLSPVEVVQAAGERVRKAATEILGRSDPKVGW